MALHEPPSVDVENVKREAKLDPAVFEWDSHDQRELDERVQEAIDRETSFVKAKIGSTAWATTDEDQKRLISGGILWRVCAVMLRQVINIIAHHAEHVVPDVADLDALERSIEDYRARETEYLGELYDVTEDYSPRIAYAFGSIGVQERESTQRLPHLVQETEEADLDQYWVEDEDA